MERGCFSPAESRLRPLSTKPICPRPSFLTGVVGQSQPSVRREGTNRVHWPVSKNSVSTEPIFLTYVSLPFDVRQEKRLSGHRPLCWRPSLELSS